jgi:hypothetical protein
VNKLIKLVIFSCTLFALVADAAPPIYEFRMKSYSWFNTNWYPNVGALCSDFATAYSAAGGRPASCSGYSGTQMHMSDGWDVNIEDSRPSCADGSTPNTGEQINYQCPDKTTPPPDKPCTAGEGGRWNFETTKGGPPIKGISDGTCEIDITGVEECYERKDKTSYCTYDTKKTGNRKSPGSEGAPSAPGSPTSGDSRSPVPPITPPDSKCPSGTTQGGSDSSGIPICIGMGSTPQTPSIKPPVTTKPPVTVDNPDGSKTTTETKVQSNSDGSTTTTKTTTTVNSDGTTSKSTDIAVSKNTAGDKGKTDADPEKNDFCKSNPTLAVCRDSSVSGTCGNISCVGDAIQCATLRAASIMQCRQKDDLDSLQNSSFTNQGGDILSGNDPMKSSIDAALKGDVVDLGSSKLDQSGFLAGGSCFPDKTINVLGQSVTMSFASVCSNIQPLRYVFLAIGFLVAYLMVSKSVLQG